MRKVNFNYSLAKSGDSELELTTKRGFNVRIICWDLKGANGELADYPIVGLVSTESSSELVRCYTADGCEVGKDTPTNNDLIMLVPDSYIMPDELTDLEKLIGKNMYGEAGFDNVYYYAEQDKLKDIRKVAEELFNVAKEEFGGRTVWQSSDLDVLKRHVSDKGVSGELCEILNENGIEFCKVGNERKNTRVISNALQVLEVLHTEWVDSDYVEKRPKGRYSTHNNFLYDNVTKKQITFWNLSVVIANALNILWQGANAEGDAGTVATSEK